jgi:hypothetical protein
MGQFLLGTSSFILEIMFVKIEKLFFTIYILYADIS